MSTTKTKVREHPIIFTAENVRAIIDGRKLEITDVRVQRVHRISDADVLVEGIDPINPWCWAITFEVVQPEPIDAISAAIKQGRKGKGK